MIYWQVVDFKQIKSMSKFPCHEKMYFISSLLTFHVKYPECSSASSNIWNSERLWGRKWQREDVRQRGVSWHLCIYENYLCCNCFLIWACRTWFFMLDLVYKVIHHCPRVVTQNVAHIKFQNEHVVKIDAHYVLMAAISSFMCQDEYPRVCVCVWVWVGGRSVHLLVLSVAFTSSALFCPCPVMTTQTIPTEWNVDAKLTG